jgi:hypothetical protein
VKYAFSALVAAVILIFLPYTTTLSTSFLKAFVGMAVYVGVLLAIDLDSRNLVRQIVKEIRSSLSEISPQ